MAAYRTNSLQNLVRQGAVFKLTNSNNCPQSRGNIDMGVPK